MNVFKTKEFARFARRAKLTDAKLTKAAADVAAGQYDADLGGGVYKQRVARDDAGKSGGYRTILLFKAGQHGFFTAGFAKNDKANLSAREVKALRTLAKVLLSYEDETIEVAVLAGELVEVGTGEDADQEA